MRNSNKAYPKKDSKPISLAEAKGKLSRYCAYQERSERQVLAKVKTLLLAEEDKDALLIFLKEEGFLNEDRFVSAIIRGKTNGRGWGPVKIAQKLRQEGISGDKVEFQLQGADFARAEAKLKIALERKKAELEQKADPQWKVKLMRLGLSRGFSWETVQEIIQSI